MKKVVVSLLLFFCAHVSIAHVCLGHLTSSDLKDELLTLVEEDKTLSKRQKVKWLKSVNKTHFGDLKGEDLKRWKEAFQSLKLMQVALTDQSDVRFKYNVDVYQAAMSLFVKHLNIYIHERSHDDFNHGRINLLLKELLSFKNNSVNTGFYRFKRAVEGEFSLQDFINCR